VGLSGGYYKGSIWSRGLKDNEKPRAGHYFIAKILMVKVWAALGGGWCGRRGNLMQKVDKAFSIHWILQGGMYFVRTGC